MFQESLIPAIQVAGVFVFFLISCGASALALLIESVVSFRAFVAAVRRAYADFHRNLQHLCRCFLVSRLISLMDHASLKKDFRIDQLLLLPP